jgi:hypothetical protein
LPSSHPAWMCSKSSIAAESRAPGFMMCVPFKSVIRIVLESI